MNQRKITTGTEAAGADVSERRGAPPTDGAPMLTAGYFQVAAGAILWGAWPLFTREASISPLWATSIVFATVALVLGPLLARPKSRGTAQGEPPRRPAEWWFIGGVALFNGGSLFFLFAAVQSTTVAIATLGHCSAPILVAALAPTVLRTPRRRWAVSSAILAAAGIVFAVAPWRASAGTAFAGAGLGLIGAALAAGNVLLNKKLGGRFTAEERLVYHASLAALALGGAALAWGLPRPSVFVIAKLALGGALVGATGGLLVQHGLNRIPAESAGMLGLLEPLSAMALAWAVWREAPHWTAALGATIVLMATVISIRAGEVR